MLCCFGGTEAAEKPTASLKYAANEDHALPTEPSHLTATATEITITRKESSTNNDGASSNASASWNPMAEVKQMMGTMKSSNHTGGLGEEELTLLEPIGKGGFGTVYKGKWRNLEVAVKMVVFAQFGPGGVANDKRAITEAAVCSSVIHQNVTATYHYDIRPVQNTETDKPNQEEWKLTLVQELCHASLADALVSSLMHNKQNQQPNMVILLWTLADIAKGMSYIHSKGIIHGDLKPENVLLKHDPDSPIGMTAKITDFGLCSTLDASKTHISGFNTGTPFYSAPEIATTCKATPFSDVYSFGILMIEVYRNVPPWVRTPNGFRPNKAFMQFPQDSPRPYVQLAQRCLSKEPKNRPNFVEVLYLCESMYLCLLEGWRGLERQEGKSQPDSVDKKQAQAALEQVAPENGSRPLTEEFLSSVRQGERRVSQSAIEAEDPPSK